MDQSLITLFCFVDDFCKAFIPVWEKQLLTSGSKKRRRKGELSMSEIMTIYIHFHQSHYRNLKHYYLNHVTVHLRHFFPKLVSYSRFITLIKSSIIPLCLFSQTLKGEETGIYFIDSTIIKACHIKRERQHKVFSDMAKKAKSNVGWFFGFKLHLVINDKGELMAFKITAGNVDDRKVASDLVIGLVGKLIGDKGYLSNELKEFLMSKGIELITKIKKNMKNKFMPSIDKLLLRKRAIIETVNDQLKNIAQIEHTRHRSIWNFAANILAALCAYALQPKKPSIHSTQPRMHKVLSAM
jgi:IS5 family transposase